MQQPTLHHVSYSSEGRYVLYLTFYTQVKEKTVNDKQAIQKARHDTHVQTHQFSINQPVMAKNWSTGPEWIPATIVEKLGPLTFRVKTQDGTIWKRHVDHLKQLEMTDSSISSYDMDSFPIPADIGEPMDTPDINDTTDNTDTPPRRYPSRNRKSPDRLM